ncbi:MAG: PglZ domain-containing protein [Acidobacteriota bacterium]
MILAALVEEFTRRFQHEKRARVCLWFDEKQEFEAILPKLQHYLATHQPPPFTLLEYDPAAFHGQIWLKNQVRCSPADHHFVFYLPLSEDRMESPDPNGEHYLEMLAEYRLAGITWKLNGKQPTLFSFLRQAAVELPENPAEQRRLYDGGRNSLLAKYAAKFADRPASFWRGSLGTLTAERAQEQLIGDLEKTILDIAAAPETEWKVLETKGLAGEFTSMVRERYGYSAPAVGPSTWVQGLVEMLALTETHLGYGERADFPFADRLPATALREHHRQLLDRWLKDAEGRPVWERWIREVEPRLDLSEWAADKQGHAFALPHLVALRWRRTLGEFDEATGRSSATAEFFSRNRKNIRREVEFSRANPNPVGSWKVLSDLESFLSSCAEALEKVEHANSAGDLARVYTTEAARIDGGHIRLRSAAMGNGLPTISKVADRTYASYTNSLNEKFFKLYAAQGSCELAGFDFVTDHLQRELWKRSGRRAVIIVDALRLDGAFALQEALAGHDIEIHPVRAMLPTVTPIGMTAMLPLDGAQFSFGVEANNVHPRVNGKDAALRSNRLAYLTEFGADCREIELVENTPGQAGGFGELLVVFGHEEVDHIGHGSAEALIRHVDLEVNRLALLIRRLHRWGYPEVHVITDHGFILLDEDKLPPEVPCNKDWCYVRKERFALVPAHADVPLVTFPFAWDNSMKVALPPGLAFFMAEKSFSHGGGTLQEMLIPHLVSRVAAEEKRVGIEVLVPSGELIRSAVKVALRPKIGVGASQLSLFVEHGRTLQLDIVRVGPTGEHKSVLATGRPKEARVEANGGDVTVNLFFHTTESFQRGDTLVLDVRDIDTLEQFPAGGTKLIVGRDM